MKHYTDLCKELYKNSSYGALGYDIWYKETIKAYWSYAKRTNFPKPLKVWLEDQRPYKTIMEEIFF